MKLLTGICRDQNGVITHVSMKTNGEREKIVSVQKVCDMINRSKNTVFVNNNGRYMRVYGDSHYHFQYLTTNPNSESELDLAFLPKLQLI